MERVTFLTFATKTERGFAPYLASCLRNGIVPHVLGMGQRWEGYSHKIRFVREHLNLFRDDDLVCFTDGYDVVFQKGSLEILHAFFSYCKPLVMSSEQGLGWPGSKMRLPETPDIRYRAICSGFYMGYVGAVKRMIDEAWGSRIDSRRDDQEMIDNWFARHHDRMVVDWKNILVTSAARNFFFTDFAYRDKEVYNPVANSVPCAIHPNVSGNLTKTCETLGLPFPGRADMMIPGEPAHRRHQAYVLAERYPWPTAKPNVKPEGRSYFGDDNWRFFSKVVNRSMSVILELGSWVGLGSTKFFLENSDALIICNDTWRGDSPDLVKLQKPLIPILYELFCYHRWDDRHRIIPLRMDTLDGLRTVAELGIVPDLIYVDANHSYQSVTAQLNLIHELFKDSIVTGDDFEHDYLPEVRRAVLDFTLKTGKSLTFDGNAWMLSN